jgi:uncharacterized protein (TIRG00374 family)
VDIQNLRGKLLFSLLLGIVVFAGLSFYADFSDLLSSLEEFNWALLPVILGLTAVNYALRFVKWEYYLRLIGVRGLDRRDSALIYFAGLGMVITPGKVGEWLKCYLLREVHGTPIVRSAPIIIAERLTDSIALVIIASAGVLVFGNLWQAFVAVALGCVVFIAVVRHRPTATALLRLGGRVPLLQKLIPTLEEFYESTYVLLGPSAVLAMVGLSSLSWFFEVLAFYVTLLGLGMDGSGELLLQSAFILPIATLASAILLTPGGLGVAEASITGLSEALLDLGRSEAAVGTLIIRFGTLWFGVIVGLVAFAILSRRLSLSTADLSDEPIAAVREPGDPVPQAAPAKASTETMRDAS